MPVRVAQSSSPREMIRCCRMQTLPCLPGSRFVTNFAPYRLNLWLTFYATQSFIILEVLFQVPVFFLGVRGLWKRESPLALFPPLSLSLTLLTSTPWPLDCAGDASIWPLLAIYGASSSTTTFACLATVLTMPGIKTEHLVKLLASYVPFFLVPLAMAVDYGMRLTSLVRGTTNDGKAKVQ